MSQDPNNPNRLDPSLQAGGTYDISTDVTGTFFGNLWGTYNFSSGTTFTTNLFSTAISVNSGTGNTSVINLDSTVIGRVSINGVTEFNFSDTASIDTTGTAITLSNAAGVVLDANIDGAITARTVLSSAGNATVNIANSAVLTGTSTAQTALSIGASSTLNFNGEISGFRTGVVIGGTSVINISSTAIIDVTTGRWISAGDDTNLTISAGATFSSTSLTGGGISIGDNSIVDLQADLVSGGSTLSIGLNTGFVLGANRTLQSIESDAFVAEGNNTVIINGTVIGDDEGLDLNGNNTALLVASDATVSATGASGDAIAGTGTGHVYDIFGTVLAEDDGIIIGGQGTLNLFGDVSVGGTAIIVGVGTSVDVSGDTLIVADGRVLTASSDLILSVGAGVELRSTVSSLAISAVDNANITLAEGSELNSLNGRGISVRDNAQVTLNGNITTDDTALNLNDAGIVNIGQNAVITVTDGDVISVDNGSTINVAGTLTALDDIFGAIRGDAENTINLLQSGVINSEFITSTGFASGNGIFVFDENNIINVHGTINASRSGIDTNSGGGNTITVFDTGVINARIGIQTTNDRSAPLANSVLVEGTLNVSDVGVDLFGIGDSAIVTGAIVGTANEDPNSAIFDSTGVLSFAEGITVNVSGDISDLDTAISLSGANSEIVFSGEITNAERGIVIGGENSTLDIQGTINAQFQGVGALSTNSILDISGTINAFGGLVIGTFTFPPVALEIIDFNQADDTILNFSGVINTDGTGIAITGAVNATINGTINAVTAISVNSFDGDQTFTFGSGANITGDLLFGDGDDNINLSLATIADDTFISLGDGNDTFVGSAADEIINIGFDNNVVDGGDGSDIAVIDGLRASFTVTESNGVIALVGVFSNTVTTFENVEFFTFSDGTLTAEELLLSGLTIEGTAGDDIIDGTEFFEFIFGFDGNDTINGLEGNDEIEGGNGDDILNGGDGDDDIDGGDGDDVINGGNGNDFLRGRDGADIINGDAGDDFLVGDSGDDTLNGGEGTDIAAFVGSIEDFTFSVDAGVYTITDTTGVEGTDTVTEVETFLFFDALVSSEAIDNQQIGTSEADTLTGTSNDDLIFGLAGSDIINSGVGNDVIIAGAGDDFVNASNGNDFIFGGEGDDIIIGGSGFDDVDGGNGTDQARYANSDAAVFVDLNFEFAFGGHADGDRLFSIEDIFGSNHDDTLTGDDGDNVLSGSNGDDTLTGAGGTNNLIGGNGDDTFIGGAGADFNNGGGGFGDTIDYSGSFAAVEARLGGSQVFDGGFATGDDFQGIEDLIGSAFDDALVGNVRANVLTGNAGDDFINGDRGTDTLLGGDGDDTLIGGFGQDTLDGGDGIDTARYANANSRAVVNLETGEGSAGHSFGDTLISIENLFGSVHNDVFIGDSGANQLSGFDGVDRLTGGEGNDVLVGGNGNDRFIFTDNWDNDTITDFEDGGDLLDFRTVTGVDALSDLMVANNASGDAVISFGGDSVTLTGIDAADIDAGDFLF